MLKEILQAEGRGYLMESWIYTGTNATRNRLVNKFFLTFEITLKANGEGASLLAQWLRIRLPMQGTWVRALVREDPTCHGATKPVCHNY